MVCKMATKISQVAQKPAPQIEAGDRYWRSATGAPEAPKSSQIAPGAYSEYYPIDFDPPGLSFHDSGNNSGIVFCILPNLQAPNSMQNTCRELAKNFGIFVITNVDPMFHFKVCINICK